MWGASACPSSSPHSLQVVAVLEAHKSAALCMLTRLPPVLLPHFPSQVVAVLEEHKCSMSPVISCDPSKNEVGFGF